MSERLSSLSKHEKELLFEALLFCIRSNPEVGLKGYDQGHPVYHHGAKDGDNMGWEYADGPDQNLSYQLYHDLSLEMVDSDSVSRMRRFCAVNWQEFCTLPIKYHKARNGTLPLPPAYGER